MGMGRSIDRGRILLVEDSRMQRMLMAAKLREAGYEVVEAGNGREALEVLEREAARIDLVLLDIMMPEMDGIAFLEQVRGRFSRIDLPVIAATGKDRSEDIVAGLRAGANDYVAKPVDVPVLLARVETQLSLKRTHDALRDAQRALIRAARMESVGILAAGVAHEIRNPLAMMRLSADGLKASGAVTDPAAAPLLEALISSVEKADRIVTDLMRASQAQQLELVPGDVNELVRAALGMLEEEIGRHGIKVREELGADLPQALISRHDLRQALVNVFLNAIQAMAQGGELLVRTGREKVSGLDVQAGQRTGNRLHNGEDSLLIVVEDSGPGIPAELMGKVFDPFFTTRAPGLGMGLGLTVARQLIALHRGLLRLVNREHGSGVRAEIFLKRAEGFGTSV